MGDQGDASPKRCVRVRVVKGQQLAAGAGQLWSSYAVILRRGISAAVGPSAGNAAWHHAVTQYDTSGVSSASGELLGTHWRSRERGVLGLAKAFDKFRHEVIAESRQEEAVKKQPGLSSGP